MEPLAVAREAAQRRRRHGGVGRVLSRVRPDGLRDRRRGPGGRPAGRTRRRRRRRRRSPSAIRPFEVSVGGQTVDVHTGSVAIAAITSCTNTSNPTVMVGAGLLARNAIARGLRVAPTVKTSLAPGSRAVTGYLEAAGLMAPLAELGFALAGYGCTTCIGNSGPLDAAGGRGDRAQRPGRRGRAVGQPQLRGPHPPARAGELPRLAAAGRGLRARRARRHRPDDRAARRRAATGRPVFLADIWPAPDEIRSVIADSIDPELFRATYAVVFEGDERWRALPIPEGDRYAWDPASTYVAKPPFFDGLSFADGEVRRHRRAHARWPSSATRSRPTTSRRPARSRRGRPPGSGSRSTASGRSSSTRTARGAATTR